MQNPYLFPYYAPTNTALSKAGLSAQMSAQMSDQPLKPIFKAKKSPASGRKEGTDTGL